MPEVVDTRFLIEYFYSENSDIKHRITQKIRQLVKNREGIIPTIVIGEIIWVTCERRGIEEAKIRYLSLIRSGLRIEELTPEIAKEAGLIKCKHKDIPMGDCIIASTAKIVKAKVLSDDPHYDLIKEIKCNWI